MLAIIFIRSAPILLRTLVPMLLLQGDLQRLLSQESSLKQQVAAVQERIASTERARASDKAFLQVRPHWMGLQGLWVVCRKIVTMAFSWGRILLLTTK
jgi:hypothetical protein